MKLHTTAAVTLLAALIALPASAHDRTYRNAEFGLQETFPAGVKVCTALSGNHPHGFYGLIGPNPGECQSEKPNISVIGVYASWNTIYYKTPFAELPGYCRKPKPNDFISAAALKHMRIPGVRSVACFTTDRPIAIEVVALAGKPLDEDDPEARNTHSTIYHVTLATSPQHFRRDLPMFRRFLASLRVMKRLSRDDSQCDPCTPF